MHTIDPAAVDASAQDLPSRTARLIDAIAECVPETGTDRFIDRFLQVVELTGAGQVTSFAYEGSKAICLISRNFLSEDRGGTLAATYVDGWFRDDPLFGRVMAMPGGSCTIERLEDLLPRMDPRYHALFFGAPGFRTKVATLVSQGSLRMIFNLYFERGRSDPPPTAAEDVVAGIYRLVGRCLAAHFLQLKSPSYPLPLAVLSDRERQVCLGMLAGKKAEIIAEDIGVGQSSVVTYRKRAYQKLGISSRGQLFSICRSLGPGGNGDHEGAVSAD